MGRVTQSCKSSVRPRAREIDWAAVDGAGKSNGRSLGARVGGSCFMRVRWVAFLSVLVLAVGLLEASPAAAAPGVLVEQGTIDGAAFLIEIPSNWNHILALYSHGYAFGPANPARDVGDPLTHDYLLSRGYALAGSSYSRTGWAIKEALHDQIALLDYFDAKY